MIYDLAIAINAFMVGMHIANGRHDLLMWNGTALAIVLVIKWIK